MGKVKSVAVEGVVPPQSLDLEKTVLGCILIDTAIMGKISNLLSIDSFYSPQHQLIYEAMVALFAKNNPIDYLTLTEELKRSGKIESAGGENYVRDLSDVVSTANYEVYARKVEEKAIARRVISISNETQQRLYEGVDDVFDVVNEHSEKIFKAQSSLNSHKNISPDHVGRLLIDQMYAGMRSDGMIGVPTGVPMIDSKTGGFQKQWVITIGARTRHGKSAVAAGFMYNATLIDHPDFGVDASVKSRSLFPTGFLSMEMQNTEVFARLVSMEILRIFNVKIAYGRIQKGRLDEDQAKMVLVAVENLAKRGIYIDDTPALNPVQVKSKVMKMINDYGITKVYLDYIQLTADSKDGGKLTTADKLSSHYTEFKNQAKFFNIPYIILSQVDRLTEKAAPRPPIIADLKGSGGIEEKSDVILLLYRPEVNEPFPTDEHGRSLRGSIMVDIAKHKQGDTGSFYMPFDVATNTFGDLDDFEEPILHVPEQPAKIIHPFQGGFNFGNNDINDATPF